MIMELVKMYVLLRNQRPGCANVIIYFVYIICGVRNCGSNNFTCKCGKPAVRPRIVNGVQVDFHEFPWMVQLLYNSYLMPVCGGALVSSTHVVSAAHCFKSLTSVGDLLLRLGQWDLLSDQPDSFEERRAQRVWIPCEYNSDTYRFDVTLIALTEPVRFSTHVYPICLPSKLRIFDIHTGTIAGWGAIRYKGPSSSVLRKTDVRILDRLTCLHSSLFSQIQIPATSICGQGHDSDSCQGDSGGPLMFFQEEINRYFIIGITSFGHQCNTEGFPGIYTSLFHRHVYAWIYCQLRNESAQTMCDEAANAKFVEL